VLQAQWQSAPSFGSKEKTLAMNWRSHMLRQKH
jgi:hypothetical protein